MSFESKHTVSFFKNINVTKIEQNKFIRSFKGKTPTPHSHPSPPNPHHPPQVITVVNSPGWLTRSMHVYHRSVKEVPIAPGYYPQWEAILFDSPTTQVARWGPPIVSARWWHNPRCNIMVPQGRRSCSHISLARGVARVYSGLSESVAFGLMMHKLVHMF